MQKLFFLVKICFTSYIIIIQGQMDPLQKITFSWSLSGGGGGVNPYGQLDLYIPGFFFDAFHYPLSPKCCYQRTQSTTIIKMSRRHWIEYLLQGSLISLLLILSFHCNSICALHNPLFKVYLLCSISDIAYSLELHQYFKNIWNIYHTSWDYQ